MTLTKRDILLFFCVFGLIFATGFMQSWNVALGILNMGLISAILALGVNMQWGYAGLFNIGVMGFVALGGLAAVLIGMPPVGEAWSAGGSRLIIAIIAGAMTIVAAALVFSKMAAGRNRTIAMLVILIGGFFIYRGLFDPAVSAIEKVNPAGTGYLGGLNFPALGRISDGQQHADLFILLAWPFGALLAAGAAWLIGKTALGLRSDYLAIATLGIAEIVVAVLKNEDWLSRGVKNVNGLPRPVPYEITLQNSEWFTELMMRFGLDPVTTSSIAVKLCYAAFFTLVLLILLWLAQAALNSPWGRMMRAIRDNEVAAEAMGKDVTARHLQIFIIGSAVCGLAGAMMTTLDGQLTPSTYQPLRFTFLIWVMVIVGGSGNNFGAILGGFLIWYLWVMVEPIGQWVAFNLHDGVVYLADDLSSRSERMFGDIALLTGHFADNVQHLRLFTMGLILLLVLRFSPRGLIPER